ncbi:uncharacterized protein LOC133734646 isoform X1 [Rosa rugosa]|uniref:uncharacterized protein LOC133734646 isoform X1 n=1 Tax=Rosa rugosa TaxID=74645 RepID=UPI002B40B962|nr:uncharacterized protein LOC133734646 isoform X1 [Rosa rugosa]
MSIWMICKEVYHKAPGMLFVSGFLKKIIHHFLGLLRVFRGEQDTAASASGQHQKQAQPAKLHDPRPGELEEILIATVQTGSKVEERDPSDDRHCRICDTSGDHSTETCPERSKAYVVLCGICDDGPCQNEADHKEEHYEELLFCYICNKVGEHWTENCPDNDCDFDPPNGWDLTENKRIDLFPPL